VTDVLGSRQGGTRTVVTLFLALAISTLWSRTLGAAPADPPVLSQAQQLAIARAFAPTLVFHPDERYFPTSSMGAAAEGWSARIEAYRALSRPEKLSHAALAYRAFSRLDDGHVDVIVEYWCYYVYNAYTIRGSWLAYRVPDNHPNDLERLYVVLRSTEDAWRDGPADDAWARGAFRVSRVVANAHGGSIPPNQYNVPEGEALEPPVTILVERGSHAMAPDVDRDGRFLPGVDSTARSKVQWGVRDDGSTWRWYRQSFMDRRDASAIRLCGPLEASDPVDSTCPRYSLYPADDLQHWFEDLALSTRDREDVVGRTPWLVRAFGDVRVEHLMAPPDAADGREFEKLLQRRKLTETGFVVGFTTVDHAPTVVLSRRFFWEVPSPRYPDVLVEAVALLPKGRRTLVETTVWGSYNVDAITNVLVGFGWFSERGGTSPVIGAEVRIGRFRLRPNWRLRDGGFDARVTTTF